MACNCQFMQKGLCIKTSWTSLTSWCITKTLINCLTHFSTGAKQKHGLDLLSKHPSYDKRNKTVEIAKTNQPCAYLTTNSNPNMLMQWFNYSINISVVL